MCGLRSFYDDAGNLVAKVDERGARSQRTYDDLNRARTDTPVEALLIDLVQMAETPLYSAYAWLGKQLGRPVAMAEFLSVVDTMMKADVLRLWQVDTNRTELYELPSDLRQQYASLRHDEPDYDPLGLSITLGDAADRETEPDWKLDIDFDRGRFEITATSDAEASALQQATRYYPDIDLVVDRRLVEGATIRLTGHVVSDQTA